MRIVGGFQRVVLNGRHSAWTPVQSGVLEGSILGPLLFACYVADIPLNIRTSSIMYADDVKLYHRIQSQSDVDDLQADLDRLLQWSNTWRLILNPAKCKFISFTLRTCPIESTYTLNGHSLERCDQIRDLGVFLDSKLTFAHHIDVTVAKANRMLGLLMRSMQLPQCPRSARFNHKALTAAFNAHVGSVIQYASVIWSGAATTHLARLERVQHRFLIWLGAKTRSSYPSMDYPSLLQHFNISSIKARFVHADILFMRKLLQNRIDSTHLVSCFGLNVPGRRLRQPDLFHEPFGRVNTVKNGLFVRIPHTCNLFARLNPTCDFFASSVSFRREVLAYARGLSTYVG